MMDGSFVIDKIESITMNKEVRSFIIFFFGQSSSKTEMGTDRNYIKQLQSYIYMNKT